VTLTILQKFANKRLVKYTLTPFETKLMKYANNGEILLDVCTSVRAHCNNNNTLMYTSLTRAVLMNPC